VDLWGTEDYLAEKLGSFVIPVVRNAVVGTLQDHRELVNFGEAFREMYRKEYSTEYLFFPVKSRFSFNGSSEGRAQELQDAVDDICRKDLDFNRIWHGFSNKSTHWNFLASQFVIGKSVNQFNSNSTGSDWHCAGGNNWFIQAVGRKYWYAQIYIENRKFKTDKFILGNSLSPNIHIICIRSKAASSTCGRPTRTWRSSRNTSLDSA
jgi:hypothetical protein